MILGLDTSHFNGDITHIVNDPTITFVIGQCTIGTKKDSAYAGDRKIVRKAGKLWAAYHYAVYGPGPTRQAEAFLAAAGDADWLMIDAEARGTNGLLDHPKTISAIILNVRRLDPKKRKITLYSSNYTDVTVKGHPDSIWHVVREQDSNHVAYYGHTPTVPWNFWQYSGTGVDHDKYNGTLDDLKHWAGVA